VSRGFFPALGTAAARGRTLVAAEHVAGANRAAVVSHGFWRQQLGGDPGAVGPRHPPRRRAVHRGRRDAARLRLPPARRRGLRPVEPARRRRRGRRPHRPLADVVARLRPGVTPAQGRAEVEALLARFAAAYPETNGGWTAAGVEGVRDSIVGPVRRGLLVLFGAVVLVLLVVCANVANLLLVRGTARTRELALRAALGAGRGRLVRLVLGESVLLAAGGGLLGAFAAWWAVRALVALAGDYLPRAADVRVDPLVLAFAVLLALGTGVVCGLWPAFGASAGRGSRPRCARTAAGAWATGRPTAAARRSSPRRWRWPWCSWSARGSCCAASSGSPPSTRGSAPTTRSSCASWCSPTRSSRRRRQPAAHARPAAHRRPRAGAARRGGRGRDEARAVRRAAPPGDAAVHRARPAPRRRPARSRASRSTRRARATCAPSACPCWRART
jgi:hypothetical protein